MGPPTQAGANESRLSLGRRGAGVRSWLVAQKW
jgi:hypothetical protein